ncbi:MAG: type I methionyl aminopeptidase [Chloroflexi bacterium]|nr:type I methionyl aminopeptidase [Chloroflexota bacterium]
MATVTRKSHAQLVKMRRAGQITALALQAVAQAIHAGVSTAELDRIAEKTIRGLGAVPSFKGYHGYPASICASINDEIVHGIPSRRQLREGDIVSIDAGAIWRGYQGDSAITVAVDQVEPRVQALIQATQDGLHAGIAAVRVGATLGDVSHAIQAVADAAGFGVVREYGGHGIGAAMHEPPRIPNWGAPGRGLVLETGMTLAIEPMYTMRGYETRVLSDDWTVVTADGSWAAHWEHTVAVTETGAEILTLVPDGAGAEVVEVQDEN